MASLSEWDGAQDLFLSGTADGKVRAKVALQKKATGLAFCRDSGKVVVQCEEGAILMGSQDGLVSTDSGPLGVFN